MELILFLAIWWCFAYGVERAKTAQRAATTRYANQIHAQNPTWSHTRVRNAARRRAWAWWAHEAVGGLPTLRQAWSDDWQHIQHMRENDRLNGERRRETIRKELDELRGNRQAHRELRDTGQTELSFPQWLDAGRPGLPTPPAPAPSAPSPGTAAPATVPSPTSPGTAAPAAPPAPAPASPTPATSGGRHLHAVPNPAPGTTAPDDGNAPAAGTTSGGTPAAPSAPASGEPAAAPTSPAPATVPAPRPEPTAPAAAGTQQQTPAAGTPAQAGESPHASAPDTNDPAPAAAPAAGAGAATAGETRTSRPPVPAAAANGSAVPANGTGGASTAPSANGSPSRDSGTAINGGSEMSESMEAPNIDAARQVVSTQATSMAGIAANSEQLVNDMLAGGMGNDQQTMSAIANAQELTAQAAAAWQAAHNGMAAHAQGEEYANTGIAAKTEFLKS